MNRVKIFIFVFFVAVCMGDLVGQDAFDLEIMKLKKKYSVPKLSKTQMYADFDTLVSIMERCNPQYLVRKKVTGYDMLAEMKTQRVQIENCKNTLEYIKLLKNIFFLTLDEHCFIDHSVWWFSNGFRKNDIELNSITDKDFGINFHYQDDVFFLYPPEINFIYTNGKYFLRNKTTFYNGNDFVVLPIGTEILTFNNQLIISYLDSIKTRGNCWDFNKKIYYNITLYIADSQNSIGYIMDNKLKEISFTNFIQEEREDTSSEIHHHLHWFEKDSVLYFKIPVMQPIDISWYMKMKELHPDIEITIPEWALLFEEKVLSYRSKHIKSVIIDVRGNPGGNDLAWIQLLGMICKTTIEYPYCYLITTDAEVAKRLPTEEKQRKTVEYLDNQYVFQVFEEGVGSIDNTLLENSLKSEQNLGYDGTIYLLMDEDIYSSTGAFASLCTKTDRIKTIGMPTGKILGKGATPSVFKLPHSRLIFTMELMLDAAGVSKAEDFYHDHINYPVTPSIEYYKYWYDPNRPYTIDEKAMYEHDEVFIKALDIIKGNKK